MLIFEGLSLAAVGVGLSGLLLANDAGAAVTLATALIHAGRHREARRILSMALENPHRPWNSWEQRAYLVYLHLSLVPSSRAELERTERFLAEPRPLSDKVRGLLLAELSRLQQDLGLHQQAAETSGQAWSTLHRVPGEDESLLSTLGVLARILGMPDRAEQYFRRSLAAGRDLHQSRLGLALTTPDGEEQRELLRGLTVQPEVPDSIRAEAFCHLSGLVTEPEKQLQYAEQGLELGLGPGLAWLARVSKVNLLVQLDRRDEAERLMDQLREQSVQMPRIWAMTLANLKLWKECWETYSQVSPTSRGEASLVATAAYQNGLYQKTLDLVDPWLTQASQDSHHSELVLLDRAVRACQDLRDYERAGRYLKRLHEVEGVEPEDRANTLLLEAETDRLRGRLERCRTLCLQAVELGAPGSDLTYWWTVGRFDKTQEALDILRGLPKQERAYEDMDAVEGALLVTQERYDEALSLLQRGLPQVHEPRSRHHYEALVGVCHAALGDSSRALTLMEELHSRSHDLSPRDHLSHLASRAQTLMHLQRPEAALELLEELLSQAHPVDLPSHHYARGLCLLQLDQTAAAREAFSTAADACPGTYEAERARERLD